MYHDFAEMARGSYTLLWQMFLEQLDRLLADNFVVEGFGGLEKRLASGVWPHHYALVSFDDGHQSFIRAAKELIVRGFQGTFFLTRDACLKRPDFLKSDEIRELSLGVEVGTHGMTHRPLSLLSETEARLELRNSKHWLEDLIGREVRHMSAPGGYWNRTCQRLAREVGYTLVGNSVQWWNRPDAVARSGQVNRVALRAQFGPAVFDRILSRDLRFYGTRRLRSLLLALPNALRGRWELRRRRAGAE